MNAFPEIKPVTSRREVCMYQAGLLAMAVFKRSLPTMNAVFFSSFMDHPESQLLIATKRQGEALIVLAGPVACSLYLGIPLDGEGFETNHVFSLAKLEAPQDPLAQFNKWIAVAALAFKEEPTIGFLALAIFHELERVGVLTGEQVLTIAEPYMRFWYSEGNQSPVGPLTIQRDSDPDSRQQLAEEPC